MDSLIKFNNCSEPTIGVEVELQIVDKDSMDLYPGAPQILDKFKDNIKVKEELLSSIIEITTGICKNVEEARSDLSKTLCDVIEYSKSCNLELVSMATHPFATWKDQSVTQNERYIQFLDRMRYPLRRLIITGLHVHIGVESGEKAIAITNGLLRYIPMFIAISSNSPFFEGQNTGLASTRTKIFEGLPTAGLPPYLRNFSEFQRFMRTLQRAKTIQSIREVWWDIRPHPGFGTVEIRVCDAVPTLGQIVDLAALCQCIVVGLSNYYDNGTQLPLLDSWIIKENKWRATRYGIDAQIIIDEKGTLQQIQENILNTIDLILPLSEELDCKQEILNIKNRVLNDKTPYKDQISIYKKSQSFKELIAQNIKYLIDGL